MLSVYLMRVSARCEAMRGAPTHPSRIKVLILKPNVGLIPEISSSLSFLRIVVLPALSRPLRLLVSYLSFPSGS